MYIHTFFIFKFDTKIISTIKSAYKIHLSRRIPYLNCNFLACLIWNLFQNSETYHYTWTTHVELIMRPDFTRRGRQPFLMGRRAFFPTIVFIAAIGSLVPLCRLSQTSTTCSKDYALKRRGESIIPTGQWWKIMKGISFVHSFSPLGNASSHLSQFESF